MLGSVASSNDLGAIPCAISWLYKGINEKRQKSGARFSVRVSALGINATKPGSSAKDLLAALATGNYLNARITILSFSCEFNEFYHPIDIPFPSDPDALSPSRKIRPGRMKSEKATKTALNKWRNEYKIK